MGSVNRVFLIGNLGNDPEIKYLEGGSAVARFSLATSEKYTDKHGERKEDTEWHRVTVWGKLAETCAEHLKKGRSVCVEGKIKSSKYEDGEGVSRMSFEIVARGVSFLGSQQADEVQANVERSRPVQRHAQGQLVSNDAPQRQQRQSPHAFEDMVPF